MAKFNAILHFSSQEAMWRALAVSASQTCIAKNLHTKQWRLRNSGRTLEKGTAPSEMHEKGTRPLSKTKEAAGSEASTSSR